MEDLIIKYLNETATYQEKQQLLEWLKCGDDNKKLFRDIQKIWLASGDAFQKEAQVAQAYTRFKESVEAYERSKKTTLRFPLFRVVAAASVLVAIFSLGGYFVGRNSIDSSGVQTQILNNVIMGKDSKGSVVLPDGTEVWLNTGSKLIYPESFSKEARVVKLEGEGYFNVVRNPQVPFFVETNEMTVNVLGTQFDMKNYPNRKSMETTLLSGKVEVRFKDMSTGIVLKPNQKISIDKATGKHEVKEFNAQNQILWINDQQVLQNQKLSDVLQIIGFWYGMEIIHEGKVDLNQRLSLTIRKETKEEIFKLLSLIAPIEYEMETERIIVRPQ